MREQYWQNNVQLRFAMCNNRYELGSTEKTTSIVLLCCKMQSSSHKIFSKKNTFFKLFIFPFVQHSNRNRTYITSLWHKEPFDVRRKEQFDIHYKGPFGMNYNQFGDRINLWKIVSKHFFLCAADFKVCFLIFLSLYLFWHFSIFSNKHFSPEK